MSDEVTISRCRAYPVAILLGVSLGFTGRAWWFAISLGVSDSFELWYGYPGFFFAVLAGVLGAITLGRQQAVPIVGVMRVLAWIALLTPLPLVRFWEL